ncbi:MAG: hypothetical protein AAFN63_18915, partial [Pseudomonadota bacterium]
QTDRNGGGDEFVTRIEFQNTLLSDLTVENFTPPFALDGSGIIGTSEVGTGADETLIGTIGDDTIDGGGGADLIEGGNGADLLIGGSGSDTLTGGFGADTLTGGADADQFIFGLGDGADEITDYAAIADTITFTDGIQFADMTVNQVGAHVEIGYGAGDIITVRNADILDFTEQEFIFI